MCQKDITADWLACFPKLGTYKSLKLGRIVGPFLQGVCLEKSGGGADYLPTTHIHCLAFEFPTVSLQMAQTLKARRSGTVERISVAGHDDRVREAASRLASASLLKFDHSLSTTQLEAAVDLYEGLGEPASQFPVDLYECVIVAAAWQENRQEVARLVPLYESRIKHWPANALRRIGSAAQWADNIARRVAERGELRTTVANETRRHRLERLPTVDIV